MDGPHVLGEGQGELGVDEQGVDGQGVDGQGVDGPQGAVVHEGVG